MGDQEQGRDRRGHARRPPLAEIDSWELWQAWRRGERALALPWFGLLAGFCMVLAGMYSFFFTTLMSDDTVAQVGLTLAFFGFLFYIWRRVSHRRDFALAVVAVILVISGGAFLLWVLAYRLSGWHPLAAIGGTLVLGVVGLALSLPSLNAIARQQASAED